MSYILNGKGYDVTIANDGSEAIERAREKKHFDIVFMDIKMPLMDGVETYKQIKKIISGVTVVMMTAYAVEDLIQEALEEGAHGVIYKPVDIDKAIALIEGAKEQRTGALILVADDDMATCTTFKNILQKRGYKVGTAQTGEEAIAMAREESYDIYFIDMKLPTINGLETHLAIRRIRSEAITIIMTAYGQEMSEMITSVLEKSAYSCLYKPLDMPSVLELIEEVLERKKEPDG
jgi:CheY-like chemotaxis protein